MLHSEPFVLRWQRGMRATGSGALTYDSVEWIGEPIGLCVLSGSGAGSTDAAASEPYGLTLTPVSRTSPAVTVAFSYDPGTPVETKSIWCPDATGGTGQRTQPVRADGQQEEQVMNAILRLETRRLRLRPLMLSDAPAVQLLAGTSEVADTAPNIPHPYPEGLAEQWIAGRADTARDGTSVSWAIADGTSDALYGAISLVIAQKHGHAEMGYWVGVPFWGRSYTTEAARAVLTCAGCAVQAQAIAPQ